MSELWKAKGIGRVSEAKARRIRALEAELASRTLVAMDAREAHSEQKVRAEKAEAERDALKAELADESMCGHIGCKEPRLGTCYDHTEVWQQDLN